MSLYPQTIPSPESEPRRFNRRSLLKVGGVMLGAGALVESFATAAHAATISYTDDGTNYVVNTGANLVFKVNHRNGDLVSLVYRGVEYQGYGKNSQVESGLGASTVTISATSSVVVVTVVHGTLVHYYVARAGENNIYMWSYKDADSVRMQRFIVRLKPGAFTFSGGDAWSSATSTTIEAHDIFKATDGSTHSKHYSGVRTIDYDYVGATNAAKTVGIWLARSNREKSSGGPFFRSLLRSGSTGSPDLYEIVYYGMAQTEGHRWGLNGPYVLAFTDGGAPSKALFARNLNTGFANSLGLKGFVRASGRGRVTGVGITGRDTAHPYTVGFANSDAQYWAVADSARGHFNCPNMLPGTYAMTIYKGELAVWTGSATVSAGGTTTLHTITISKDPSKATAIWRIGDWDGTPSGFKNAALVTHAHPSDLRAGAWTGNFTVGTSAVGDFPCYLWNDVNDGLQIKFKLTAAQAALAHTLRIGITSSYAGGRPRVRVNDWTSPVPPAPSSAKTRSLTVGTYRGFNTLLTYPIPARAWHSDVSQWNVLTLNIISGSTGSGFLSPGVAFDCLDLLV
jgi:rhamnogalacturonan endolyase